MENQHQIITQAASYINQSIAGLEVKNAKIDFKASWYNLTQPPGINEFIKDTGAIANSFGPDGMIIIGFDDKKKELSHATFAESGLRDSSQLPHLINKRVDRLFYFSLIETEILGFKISILHIPPSFDKPHVTRNYQTFDKQTSPRKIFIFSEISNPCSIANQIKEPPE
ncbi:MAG: RNA-binding domain-containing protein [Bacteroidota bacterium]